MWKIEGRFNMYKFNRDIRMAISALPCFSSEQEKMSWSCWRRDWGWLQEELPVNSIKALQILMEGASGFWSTFIPPTCTEHFLGISWFVSNSTTEINWEDFTQMLFWGNSLTSSIANSFFLQLFILFSATYEGSPDTVLDSAKGKTKKKL